MAVDRVRQGRAFDRDLLVVGAAGGKSGSHDADPGNQREDETQPYHAVARCKTV